MMETHWRLSRLLTAPHRLGFTAAALLLGTSALWWAVVLATRAAGIALPWAVPPPVAHGLVMALGFMPLFITGFLFTAGPRWLALPEIDAASLRMPVQTIVAGWALALPGFHAATLLAAIGVAAVALGWSALVLRFAGLVRISRSPDKLHASLVAVAGAVGAVALWLAGRSRCPAFTPARRLRASAWLWWRSAGVRWCCALSASFAPAGCLTSCTPRWSPWPAPSVLSRCGWPRRR
jgi:uncharacterized protein involved in response to NO